MSPKQFEFGPFRLDATEHLLLRNEEPVQLPPKAFEMLVLLVENSGHVLQKNELIEALWPDSFVAETNLTQNIFLLRKALGDERGTPQFIRTVPRVGYRFVAPVNRVWDETEALVVESHTREHIVIKEEIVEHEIETDENLSDSLIAALISRLQWRRWKLGLAAAVGVIVFLSIAAFSYYSIQTRSANEKKIAGIRSLAVLPFEPLDAESRDRYLGIGMADALIARLGHLEQINVRPMGSVQKYASGEFDRTFIGRELTVDAVLEGRVQKAGSRLRVQVQLFSARDHTLLWTASLEDNYTEVFSVQDELADRLASEIRTARGEPAKDTLARQRPQNVDAYEAYVKGRFFWNKRTAEGGRKAVEYYKRSLEIDPSFARGYAGLADCHLIYASVASDLLSPLGTFEFLVNRAIELDDSLAEPHAALAYHKSAVEWDWIGAEKEFARAIALNPNYVTAHHWHAYNLISMGRSSEAIAEMERARSIDPVSLIINTDLGHIYYLARENENALTALQQALELDPYFAIAHERLGEVYAAQGKYEEAIAQLQRSIALNNGPPGEIEARLGYVYATSGKKDLARQELDAMIRQDPQHQVHGDVGRALILTGLQEKELAIKELCKAVEQRNAFMALYKVDPMFDSLRSDPRNKDLLERLNLSALTRIASVYNAVDRNH